MDSHSNDLQQSLFALENEKKEQIVLDSSSESGEIIFYPNYFSRDEADAYYERCNSEQVPWNRETISMYGNTYPVPRDTAWFSRDGLAYTYSGIKMDPDPYPNFIEAIQKKIDNDDKYGFNSVLLNRYNDGSDKVSWHADDEKELSSNINIASVCFGATRPFQLRRKGQTKKELEVPMEHGSLLIMKDPLQHYWEHQIPKTSKDIGPRINLTFRKIVL